MIIWYIQSKLNLKFFTYIKIPSSQKKKKISIPQFKSKLNGQSNNVNTDITLICTLLCWIFSTTFTVSHITCLQWN